MPVPQGQITSSEGWTTPAAEPKVEEPKEVTEEEKLEIALKMHKGEL